MLLLMEKFIFYNYFISKRLLFMQEMCIFLDKVNLYDIY